MQQYMICWSGRGAGVAVETWCTVPAYPGLGGVSKSH